MATRPPALFPSRWTFRQNTIARAEGLYLRKNAERRSGWSRWGWRLLLLTYYPAVTVAMIVFWGEFAGALTRRDATPIINTLGVLIILTIILALIFHLLALILVMVAAANSTVREKTGNTWDLLLMTGIDARGYILGKWWAVLRNSFRLGLLLIPLRAGVIAFVGASISREFAQFSYYYSAQYRLLPPEPLSFIAAGLLLVPVTFLAFAQTAACGVLASVRVRRVGLAVAAGIGTALGLMVVATVLGIVVIWLQQQVSSFTGNYFDLYFIPMSWSMAIWDNGSIALTDPLQYRTVFAGGPASPIFTPITSLLSTLIVAALLIAWYGLATWLVLRAAIRQARRQGMS